MLLVSPLLFIMLLTYSIHITNIVPLLAAEAHYFFLDEKVTKNQVSKEASLRKTDKTTGCIICPLLRSLKAYALGQKTLCPFHRSSPPCFISFHPKLFLTLLGTEPRFWK
jgi:hypothetical protein